MRIILVTTFILCFIGIVSPVSSRVHCKRCLKVLNTDIKNAATKSMTAVVQAGIDLTKIRDQFGQQQANLESDLKKARDLTKTIHDKIKKAVEETEDILEGATRKAKAKMEEVKAASKALGVIEEKVGVKKTKDNAKKIRDQIVKNKGAKSKQEKQVLNENSLIATLDAAKILAKAKVHAKEKAVEQKEAVVRQDVEKLKSDMTAAESQLDDEQQAELQDERQARSMILDAVKHNQNAIAKAQNFLESIEDGIKKFHKDIEEVPLDL